ncbi:MAG: NAD-dependent epimerase/dehydratase family protein [Gammaproteobacteria bacterium]|nr:NAD-dependent epimerase/dehydratase family protein [Gammaproteobacteria bacterium]
MHKHICVMGGSGFVGKTIIARLIQQQRRVRVLTRRRERHRDLLVLPGVELIEADIHHPPALEHYFDGCDAVINLVGILNEKRDDGLGFRRAHVDLAEKIVHACQRNGISRYLHMAALHANAKTAPSYYLRSKGEALELVHAARDIDVTSFCPSVIFGPGDSFFNRFADLLRLTPGILPLACANARFAPVYVGDVADAFVRSLDNPATYGQRYELCGPQVYTLKQLVEYTAQQLGLCRKVIGLGPGLSKLMANVFEHMPLFKPITRDNYRSLQIDSVCKEAFPPIFGIEPHSMEEIVPAYLANKNARAQYDAFRQNARR